MVFILPRVSIPFFFEPNFEAVIQPLHAAVRLLSSASHNGKDSQANGNDLITPVLVRKGRKRPDEYKPVKYGDFLLSKVTNNFAKEGGGKYA